MKLKILFEKKKKNFLCDLKHFIALLGDTGIIFKYFVVNFCYYILYIHCRFPEWHSKKFIIEKTLNIFCSLLDCSWFLTSILIIINIRCNRGTKCFTMKFECHYGTCFSFPTIFNTQNWFSIKLKIDYKQLSLFLLSIFYKNSIKIIFH